MNHYCPHSNWLQNQLVHTYHNKLYNISWRITVALCLLFINRLFFFKQFQVHSRTEHKVQRFPIYPLPPHMHSLLHYQHSSPECTFVTINEPTLTHDYHPLISLGFTLGVVHSMALDKCVMTCTHHYNIQSSFTALKILCAPLIHPSLPIKTRQPLIFLLSPLFCFFQNVP